jgi:hypothetical protein
VDALTSLEAYRPCGQLASAKIPTHGVVASLSQLDAAPCQWIPGKIQLGKTASTLLSVTKLQQ